jgi:hypothetical protein
MFTFTVGKNTPEGVVSAELVRWLDAPANDRALVRVGKKPAVAPTHLKAMEHALGAMEQRLAKAALRHDQTLSQIEARMDRLRDAVGKVAEDQFVNGKSLDRTLTGLATRLRDLEQARSSGKSWFSVPGTPRRAA